MMECQQRVRTIFHKSVLFFFFNDTATTEIYTLSLHDALPISIADICRLANIPVLDVNSLLREFATTGRDVAGITYRDRKSTRLNSSHQIISYAVFCLKKKKNGHQVQPVRVQVDHGVARECAYL